MNTHHYRGFIDACVKHGLDKSAAYTLYKQAQGGKAGLGARFFSWLGRGLGHGGNVAAATGRAVNNAAAALGQGGAWVADQTIQLGGRAGAAAWRGTTGALKNMYRGYRSVRPGRPGHIDWARLLDFQAHRIPLQLIRKYPVLGAIGASVGTGYLVNKANQATLNDERNKAKLPALTPYEQEMYDRYERGMNLPGLGLDPRFFDGSWYNDFLY